MNATTVLKLSAPTAQRQRAERLSRSGRLFVWTALIVILEGAVRKWGSSALTLPLVLSRDALAFYMVLHAFTQGHLRRHNGPALILLWWSCCVIVWGLIQLMLGESNFEVFLIGLRFWLLYAWFAVAAAASMTEYDFRFAIKLALWALLFMAPLVVIQHFSPPGARINTEIDTEVEAIFIVVQGVVRTTGTFSFTAGYTTFVALCTPLVLLMLESRKRKSRQRLLAFAVLGAFVVCSIVSGSRSTVLLSGGMLGIYFLGNIMLAPGRRKVLALVILIVTVLMLGLFLYLFRDAVESTQQRFEAASQVEDFASRVLTIFIGEPEVYKRFTWLGSGVGLGSNLANYVTSGDRSFFALAETETGRTLLEGGLLGYAFVALKVIVAVAVLLKGVLLALRTRAIFPVLMWLTVVFAMFSWSYVGQLSINALFGLLLAFGLLCFRYPTLRVFT